MHHVPLYCLRFHVFTPTCWCGPQRQANGEWMHRPDISKYPPVYSAPELWTKRPETAATKPVDTARPLSNPSIQ